MKVVQKTKFIGLLILLAILIGLIFYGLIYDNSNPNDIPPIIKAPYEDSLSNINWNVSEYLPLSTQFTINQKSVGDGINHLQIDFEDDRDNKIILNLWILFTNDSRGGIVLAFVDLIPADNYEVKQLDAILTIFLSQDIPAEELQYSGLYDAAPFTAWPGGTQTVYIDSDLSASLFDRNNRIFSYEYILGDNMDIAAHTDTTSKHGGFQSINIRHKANGNYSDGQSYRAAISYYFQTFEEFPGQFSFIAKFQRLNFLFSVEISSEISILSVPQ